MDRMSADKIRRTFRRRFKKKKSVFKNFKVENAKILKHCLKHDWGLAKMYKVVPETEMVFFINFRLIFLQRNTIFKWFQEKYYVRMKYICSYL